MNLNQIQADVQQLPDQYLAQAAQNPSGTIPQYIALGELQRRQSLRSGAVQRPQGTIAQKLIQSAIAPPMPMPQQGPMQQPMMPQPQQQPMGMARGGLVGLAKGGQPKGIKPQVVPIVMPQGVIDPSSSGATLQDLFPEQPNHLNEIVPWHPKQETLESSADTVRGIYGPDPDFSKQMSGVQGLHGLSKPMAPWQAEQMFGAAIGAGDFNNPVGSISRAALATMGAQHQWNDDALKNNLALYRSEYEMENAKQTHHDAISRDILGYFGNNQQLMASAYGTDARVKEALQKHTDDTVNKHLDFFKEAAQHPEMFESQIAMLQSAAQNATDPEQQQRILNTIPLVRMLQDSAMKTINTQMGKKEDLQQQRELAVHQAQAEDAMKLAQFNQGQESARNKNTQEQENYRALLGAGMAPGQATSELQSLFKAGIENTSDGRQYLSQDALKGIPAKMHPALMTLAAQQNIPLITSQEAAGVKEADLATNDLGRQIDTFRKYASKDWMGNGLKNYADVKLHMNADLRAAKNNYLAKVEALKGTAGGRGSGLRLTGQEIAGIESNMPSEFDTPADLEHKWAIVNNILTGKMNVYMHRVPIVKKNDNQPTTPPPTAPPAPGTPTPGSGNPFDGVDFGNVGH